MCAEAFERLEAGDCYGGCDPMPETERRIQETIAYIEDAERLAGK